MAYRVLWSENAALDLEEAVRYLARESPAGARRLLTRVRKWAATFARSAATRARGADFVDGLFDSRQDLEELLVARLLTHET
ncbi:MAG: hypothetical protein HY700_08695 [Gemmatimonadetes bacterium]|nr:hypothetical protein [Gemmatimonadota bacterium]